MKRTLVKTAALLLCLAPAASAQVPWAAAPGHTIKIGNIKVVSPVTGISTAQDTYDVFAPFDGRVEDVEAELFGFVRKKTLLARMVSTDMAALLDASPDSQKLTEQRWKDIYKYTEIKPETEGVISDVYVKPGDRVSKGDRLFTVAKKVIIIGRNTAPLYSALAAGMKASVTHVRTGARFDATLTNFLPVKGDPRTDRLWLQVNDLRAGIKIGEQFDGTLLVGESKHTMLVPRGDLIESGGRLFLVTEVKPGLQTADEVELLGHTSLYLEPQTAAGADNGKDKKDR